MGNRQSEDRSNFCNAFNSVCRNGQGQSDDTMLDGFVVRQRGTGRVISFYKYEQSYLLVPLCLIAEFKPKVFKNTEEASLFIRHTLKTDTEHYSICSVRMMYAERETTDVNENNPKHLFRFR